MRSPTTTKILNDMKNDHWWIKLKREIRLKRWIYYCLIFRNAKMLKTMRFCAKIGRNFKLPNINQY